EPYVPLRLGVAVLGVGYRSGREGRGGFWQLHSAARGDATVKSCRSRVALATVLLSANEHLTAKQSQVASNKSQAKTFCRQGTPRKPKAATDKRGSNHRGLLLGTAH